MTVFIKLLSKNQYRIRFRYVYNNMLIQKFTEKVCHECL